MVRRTAETPEETEVRRARRRDCDRNRRVALTTEQRKL